MGMAWDGPGTSSRGRATPHSVIYEVVWSVERKESGVSWWAHQGLAARIQRDAEICRGPSFRVAKGVPVPPRGLGHRQEGELDAPRKPGMAT